MGAASASAQVSADLHVGPSGRAAVDVGYDKAFSAIIDGLSALRARGRFMVTIRTCPRWSIKASGESLIMSSPFAPDSNTF